MIFNRSNMKTYLHLIPTFLLLVITQHLYASKQLSPQLNTCTFNTFPYSESFENDLGSFLQGADDDLEWTRDSGGTPSSSTGPSTGAEGSWYLFIEASDPNYPSKTANIQSPCFDLSSASSASMAFQYHMYGTSVDMRLDIQASVDNGMSWSSSIWNQNGNQGDQWHVVNLDLTSFAGEQLILRFLGTTGETWQGDIAIDDFSMDAVFCTVGLNCDDGNAFTINDVYNENCDCQGTPALTGNLETYLNSYIAALPGSTGDNYSEPTASQLAIWENAVASLLAYDIAAANTLANSLNYQIVQFTDNSSSPNTIYHLLEEKSPQSNYWGTYVFNLNACRSDLVLQAPHLKYDTNTGNQAIYAFTRLNSLALFLSGTHRCNSSLASTCDGTSSICTGSSAPYRKTDMAHNTMSAFQKTTEILGTAKTNSVFVQLHGFSKQSTDPYVIMSNGTRSTPSTDYASIIKNELYNVDNTLTFKLAHIDLSWTRLIAASNTQGRFLNGSTDPCHAYLEASTGRFVNIEQEKSKLRQDASSWHKMYVALFNAFPCTPAPCNTAGIPCDDENACTTGDVYDSNCTCEGTFVDSDNDGICDGNDSCPNQDDAVIGTPCDDGNPLTINDQYNGNCSCAGTPTITGDLEAYLNAYITTLPGSTGDDYSEPNVNQLSAWENTINSLLNQDIAAAQISASTLNYQVTLFTDNTSNIEYYVLEENTPASNYWGTYVFNLEACRSDLVLQAPHLKYDSNTGNQAVYAFSRLNSLALFLSGTHRCNSSLASTCDGSTSVCTGSSDPFRLSDMAHNSTSPFQITSEILANTVSTSIFVQLHGFGKNSTDPYVIMSNGTRDTPTPDYVALIRDELYAVDNSLTFKIGHLDLSWTRLLGFSNTQGRFLNGSSDPCNTHLDIASGRFVHIEQERSKLRQDAAVWDKMYAALANTFPCTSPCTQTGQACDDGDACTMNDSYDENCTCTGSFMDTDHDGICDANDQCPNVDDGLIGSSCNDGNACTTGDIYDSTCTCTGTFMDSDNDGICDANDSCPYLNNAFIGTACNDGNACTTGDVYTSACTCTGTFVDSDNDGVCDAYDQCPGENDAIDNNANGVPDACELCTYSLVNFNNFDTDWGIWNDGGSDARRSSYDAAYAYSGTRCIRLRDNTSTSVMTTDNLDLSPFEVVAVNFTYLPSSMDSSAEDFWLQISTNGGNSFTTVEEWNLGDEFVNDQRYFETVYIPSPFTTATQLRFRCDATGNPDYVYIDDVAIWGCGYLAPRTIPSTPLAKEIETAETLKQEALSFDVFPNPFTDAINIQLKGITTYEKAFIEIFDITGRKVFTQFYHQQMAIQLSNLNIPTGQYFIRIIADGKVGTQAMLKF